MTRHRDRPAGDDVGDDNRPIDDEVGDEVGDDDRTVDQGAGTARFDTEGLLFRAALLAGHGSGARALATRLASVVARANGRSCLDAGSTLQLTVDAPGPPGLRVGLRLDDRVDASVLAPLTGPARAAQLASFLASLAPPAHASLGSWVFWTPERQSVFVDLRDPDPREAFSRLSAALPASARTRLDAVRRSMPHARPWVLRVESGEAGLDRLHLHWLLDRHADVASTAEGLSPGAWAVVVEALGYLLRTPHNTGRWVVVTPLDDTSEAALRIGNSGWTIVPEDGHKHQAVGRLMQAHGGPRDFAEALWSLCRSAATTPGWRVGRACEVRATPDGRRRVRLFFAPETRGGASAPAQGAVRAASDAGAA